MWREPFTYCADFLPLTGGVGTSFSDFEQKFTNESPFEIVSAIHTATDDRINLKITDSQTGKDIIRPQGDIRAVSSSQFENGFLPYRFPIPYIFTQGSELLISASDFSGSDNNFRYALHGNYLNYFDCPYEGKKLEPFGYVLKSGTIDPYESVTKTLIMDANAGFLVSRLTGISVGECTVLIQDERPWSSRDIHFYNMIGNAQFGNVLPSKRWIPEGKILSVKFTDISGSTNGASIVFQGEKVTA